MARDRRHLSVPAGLCLLLGASLIAACTKSPPDYPLAEHPLAEQATDLGALSAAVGTAPPVARDVGFERILNARSEPHNWLTYYGAYDGQRYSPLNQINTQNVKDLRPAWTFQFGQFGLQAGEGTYSFEAAPIVVDGVMYVSGWDGWVWAINAETGQELWRYKHEIPIDTPLCCGNVNRGVAVAKGKVFMATQNGHLVALDAVNGEPVWKKAFADIRAGESATLAPLVVKNLVIVGNSGAEYGVRGHMDAFDIDTGRRVWRTYTVPEPGEPGSETWPKEGQAWARGGGSVWITGTYDPELDHMYWGTGNPSPDFDGSVRPGDNLYTSSVLAVDPDDGAMRWHYQWTPHELWDYDGNNENILFDLDGRKLLAHFDKNGHLYILDRTNGELVRVAPFAERLTWGLIDSSGKVTPMTIPTKEGVDICPGPAGGKEWTHAAYSPRTNLLYAPIIETCANFKVLPVEFKEGLPYYGGEANTYPDHWGYVKAFDPSTGQEVWAWKNDKPMVASVLATGGDLVFAGEPSGEFNAYDARTGQLLWQHQTGSGHHSNPVSYSINGKQYVAVPVGWGGWVKG
ncbi:MAG: PQQ-dependent dehydrogenase, methanol/ethanol family, partial [Actinomycetota bacterium]|nr:PQQ-dependent dehydrogenase, methanol/ethanol family [Actinomycetota bacterium]